MAVRMGKWKAVRKLPKAPIELYDLKNDIGEEHNIADQHPDLVAKIAEILKTARTESKRFPIREAKPKRKKRKA
jgi:arylsulfatase A-like enzyme